MGNASSGSSDQRCRICGKPLRECAESMQGRLEELVERLRQRQASVMAAKGPVGGGDAWLWYDVNAYLDARELGWLEQELEGLVQYRKPVAGEHTIPWVLVSPKCEGIVEAMQGAFDAKLAGARGAAR